MAHLDGATKMIVKNRDSRVVAMGITCLLPASYDDYQVLTFSARGRGSTGFSLAGQCN